MLILMWETIERSKSLESPCVVTLMKFAEFETASGNL